MRYIFNKLVDMVCKGDSNDEEVVFLYIAAVSVIFAILWLFVCVGLHGWMNVGCQCQQGQCFAGIACDILFFILSIVSAVVIGLSVVIYITGKINDKYEEEKKKKKENQLK